jgi:hypothetical protein
MGKKKLIKEKQRLRLLTPQQLFYKMLTFVF